MDEDKILEKLKEQNLFLWSYGKNQMCLKNEKEEIVLLFTLIDDLDIFTSLKIQLTKLYSVFN